MIVYRICKTYPPDYDPLDGNGAMLNGGRWNKKGTYAVFTASSLALARAELARHINLESIPDDFRVYEIAIPDQYQYSINPLPKNWNSDPESPNSQRKGSELLEDPNILALKVPSVCDPNSYNYIINPRSKYIGQVQAMKDYPFEA